MSHPPERTEWVDCQTNKQGRRPDLAYLTPSLLTQYASATSLPQSFPLIAEIASPDDTGEELFSKAKEYLQSGCQEVDSSNEAIALQQEEVEMGTKI